MEVPVSAEWSQESPHCDNVFSVSDTNQLYFNVANCGNFTSGARVDVSLGFMASVIGRVGLLDLLRDAWQLSARV